jgi:hypothetical protein
MPRHLMITVSTDAGDLDVGRVLYQVAQEGGLDGVPYRSKRHGAEHYDAVILMTRPAYMDGCSVSIVMRMG